MVLTTGPEPFGRTALEALASGAALITSGRGGLAEICGPCAVTVDPGDAKALSRRRSAQLLDAPERRAELARAGRKRVEALFDIRAVARQMDDFIDACLARGGRGGAEARALRPLPSRWAPGNGPLFGSGRPMSPETFAVAVGLAVFAGGAVGLILQRLLPETFTTGGRVT